MNIVSILFLALVAGIVGTVTGFGSSMIMVPLLAMFLPAQEAIFLVAILHWVDDVWKILLFRQGFNLRLIVLFGLPGLIMTYPGALLMVQTDNSVLLRVLGFFCVIYALFIGMLPSYTVQASASSACIGGMLSGFFAGFFGVGGAVRSIFLLAFDLSKAVYIATSGAIGLMVDATRITTYMTQGKIIPDNFGLLFGMFLPISFGGALVAKYIVDQIPQDKFRGVVALCLFFVGLKLILFP